MTCGGAATPCGSLNRKSLVNARQIAVELGFLPPEVHGISRKRFLIIGKW